MEEYLLLAFSKKFLPFMYGVETKRINEAVQRSLMQKGGEIISDILGNDLTPTESESEPELNFAMLKLKHKVVQKK